MKKRVYILLFLIVGTICKAQNDTGNSFDLPTHSFMKFNRSFQNPTFSLFSEKKGEIVLYHRNQWFEYDDAIKTSMLNYSGNKFEKTGFGIAAFQQNIGVLKNIGGIGNFAKGIQLSDNSILAFGFNLLVIQSDLNRADIIVGENDPFLNQYEAKSLMVLAPAISVQIGKFNFGIMGDNLVDYNFKNAEVLTPFNQKTYSGHLQYSSIISEESNVLENSKLTLLAKGRYINSETFDYSGTAQFDVPKIGWLQGSYSDYYGVGVGVGFTLMESISLGLNYEKGLKDTITNLGPTYEIFFGYTFGETQQSELKSKTIKKIY